MTLVCRTRTKCGFIYNRSSVGKVTQFLESSSLLKQSTKFVNPSLAGGRVTSKNVVKIGHFSALVYIIISITADNMIVDDVLLEEDTILGICLGCSSAEVQSGVAYP